MNNTKCYPRRPRLQKSNRPINGYKHEDYVFYIGGRRYDIFKWFGANGNFKCGLSSSLFN